MKKPHPVTPRPGVRPPQRYVRPFTVLLSTVVLAAVLAGGCSGPSDEGIAQAAPEFTLPSIDGDQISLSSHKGRVVLLDFWATWCPPCRAAMPHLSKLQEEYRADGLSVMGMNMDKNQEDVQSFLDSQTLTYPTLVLDEATRIAYGGVASIPQTFLIDRKGKIRRKFLGYDHKIAAEIEEQIQILLRESP